MSGAKQPLHEHISELRNRLFVICISIAIGSTIGFIFRDELQKILIAPLGEKLYYTSPAGGFNFIFQLIIYFSLIFAFPVFIYNLVRFLQPVLPGASKKQVWILTFSSMFLGVLGALFAYFLSLPAALHFLSNFADQSLESLITTQDYLSFLGIYLLGFILIFQIPLFIYLANNVTPLPPSKLMGGLRIVIVTSIIASAIITPTTDPINLAIMAVPMIILYLFAIFIVWIKGLVGKSSVPTTGDNQISDIALGSMQHYLSQRQLKGDISKNGVITEKNYRSVGKYMDIIINPSTANPRLN